MSQTLLVNPENTLNTNYVYSDHYFSKLIYPHINVILGFIQILIVSQHLGKFRSKYLDSNKQAIEVHIECITAWKLPSREKNFMVCYLYSKYAETQESNLIG